MKKSESKKFKGFSVLKNHKNFKIPEGPIFYHPDFCSCNECIEKRMDHLEKVLIENSRK